MDDCEKILDQAADLFRESSANYRDKILSVGRMIHEYILAKLERGRLVNEEKRLLTGCARNKIVSACANRLEITRARMNELIVDAMVVDLLGGGLPLGNLSHGSIHRFRVFIRRLNGEKQLPGRSKPGKRAGDAVVSGREKWVIKEGFRETAPELFSLAVLEGWTQWEALKRVKILFRGSEATIPIRKPPPGSSKHETQKPQEDLSQMKRASAKAGPGDVADMCMELISAAEDPLAVIARLRYLTDRFKPAKKQHSFAGCR